uniref:Uncharacterized protein n=1 Tax=Panagrolaimus superbus TaxID=310955 RepID=A0A914Z2I3_9BILA
MEAEDLLIIQLVLTLLFSFVALGTSSFVIFRIFMRERQRLNETEKHAFELYDAIFQSFIPRTLSDKLSNIYKTEVDAHAMNDKPIPPSTKQVNPNQNAQPGAAQPPGVAAAPQQPAPATPNAPGIPAPAPSTPAVAPAPALIQAPVLPP